MPASMSVSEYSTVHFPHVAAPHHDAAEGGKWTVHPLSRSASGDCPSRLLRPGDPASPTGDRLRLLPSGPDLVHGPTSRGTRPSTPQARALARSRAPREGIQLR